MGWLNIFPEELELDDIWGENGRLCIKEQNFNERTYCLIWCPHEEPHCGEDGDRVELHWPENAPLRVLRAA